MTAGHRSRLLLGSLLTALSMAAASSVPASSAGAALEPYTTPDKSASAGVPAGWKVVRGDDTVIAMTGPNGEKISLGVTAVTKNAPPDAAKPPSGISFNMPYPTPIDEKFLTIWKFASDSQHGETPAFTIGTTSPMRVPPILGQCARLFGRVAETSASPANFESVICSLPVDFGGAYKNVLLYAQVPMSLAPQERALAESVMSSYRIPPAMLAKKLGPFYAAPKVSPVSGAGAMARPPGASQSSVWAQAGAADTASECFDLTVLRETPTNQLPAKCGGPAGNQ